MILSVNSDYFLNSINQSVVVMETRCVFFEDRLNVEMLLDDLRPLFDKLVSSSR
jgi:hypothetical protein